jgi:hypothetical protein
VPGHLAHGQQPGLRHVAGLPFAGLAHIQQQRARPDQGRGRPRTHLGRGRVGRCLPHHRQPSVLPGAVTAGQVRHVAEPGRGQHARRDNRPVAAARVHQDRGEAVERVRQLNEAGQRDFPRFWEGAAGGLGGFTDIDKLQGRFQPLQFGELLDAQPGAHFDQVRPGGERRREIVKLPSHPVIPGMTQPRGCFGRVLHSAGQHDIPSSGNTARVHSSKRPRKPMLTAPRTCPAINSAAPRTSSSTAPASWRDNTSAIGSSARSRSGTTSPRSRNTGPAPPACAAAGPPSPAPELVISTGTTPPAPRTRPDCQCAGASCGHLSFAAVGGEPSPSPGPVPGQAKTRPHRGAAHVLPPGSAADLRQARCLRPHHTPRSIRPATARSEPRKKAHNSAVPGDS